MTARVTWASAVRDGVMVGDLHAWRDRSPRSICGRQRRTVHLQRPRFSQQAAAEVGCPSCIKALSRVRTPGKKPRRRSMHPLADAMMASGGPMGTQPEGDPEPGEP